METVSFKGWRKHSFPGLFSSTTINPFSSVRQIDCPERRMPCVQVFPRAYGLPGSCDQSHCQTAHGGSGPCLGNLHKDKAHQTWIQHGPPSVPTVVSKGKRNFSDTLERKKLWAINCSLKSSRFVQGNQQWGVGTTCHELIVCIVHKVWTHFLDQYVHYKVILAYHLSCIITYFYILLLPLVKKKKKHCASVLRGCLHLWGLAYSPKTRFLIWGRFGSEMQSVLVLFS